MSVAQNVFFYNLSFDILRIFTQQPIRTKFYACEIKICFKLIIVDTKYKSIYLIYSQWLLNKYSQIILSTSPKHASLKHPCSSIFSIREQLFLFYKKYLWIALCLRHNPKHEDPNNWSDLELDHVTWNRINNDMSLLA
jgi:hypothetical protein